MRERFNVVLSLNTREQSQVVNLSMEIEKGSLLRKGRVLGGRNQKWKQGKGKGKRETENRTRTQRRKTKLLLTLNFLSLSKEENSDPGLLVVPDLVHMSS